MRVGLRTRQTVCEYLPDCVCVCVSRGRSATCGDLQVTGEDSREDEDEEEELKAALLEIQLRDEDNFPALAVSPHHTFVVVHLFLLCLISYIYYI